MSSAREPALPAGTSVEKDIDPPFRTSVHRANTLPSAASSKRSTNTTSGWFSMPTSPGYEVAIPPGGGGGGGGAFDTATVTAADILELPAVSRATAVSV